MSGSSSAPQPTPGARGALLLSRYRHPAGWEKGSETGKSHLRDTMTLKVEELRLGGGGRTSEATARANASAIRAWMAQAGIKPYELLFDVRMNMAPRIYVPNKYWSRVLPILATLNR